MLPLVTTQSIASGGRIRVLGVVSQRSGVAPPASEVAHPHLRRSWIACKKRLSAHYKGVTKPARLLAEKTAHFLRQTTILHYPAPAAGSSRKKSTVNGNDRSCRVVRCWHAEKRNGTGHVLRLAPALERGAGRRPNLPDQMTQFAERRLRLLRRRETRPGVAARGMLT